MAQPKSDRPLRTKLWGGDWMIAEGIFPDDLKDKLDNGDTTFSESDHWHLKRLYRRASTWKLNLYLLIGFAAIVGILGPIFLYFGYLQELLAAAAIYWLVGMVVKSNAVLMRLGPIVEEYRRTHPDTGDTQEPSEPPIG